MCFTGAHVTCDLPLVARVSTRSLTYSTPGYSRPWLRRSTVTSRSMICAGRKVGQCHVRLEHGYVGLEKGHVGPEQGHVGPEHGHVGLNTVM